MNGIITCSVKEAIKLMEHLDENDMVALTIIDKRVTITHSEPQRIKKKNSEKLFAKAKTIEYQDNDFFGRFSLYGTTKERDIIQNILFPQLE